MVKRKIKVSTYKLCKIIRWRVIDMMTNIVLDDNDGQGYATLNTAYSAFKVNNS